MIFSLIKNKQTKTFEWFSVSLCHLLLPTYFIYATFILFITLHGCPWLYPVQGQDKDIRGLAG